MPIEIDPVITERCVNCGQDTGVPVTLSVDRRLHYIEGAGQLCRDCCHGIYPGHCRCPQTGYYDNQTLHADWVM
ncbi:MAG TPA: hypothetical protein VJ553_00795 [Candidatus Paceibacterota bacterium]|nr:hypothetical protein [Candidatus Paceibacterota bacterium]